MIKLNGKEIEFSTFPNGETRIEPYSVTKSHFDKKITWKYENDGDLIKLMFVKNYIGEAELTILYMPYSRMDRVEGGNFFTLKDVARFINGLNFTSVKVVEPHSDVTMALLDRSEALFPSRKLASQVREEIKFRVDRDYIFFPDSGADKRYSMPQFKTLVGIKKRDFKTGKIDSLQVMNPEFLNYAKVLIVDDLCSYGGTFTLSAQALKALGAKEVYLVVTHCENSIFEGLLLKNNHIDGVFTTDTILNLDQGTEKLKIYDIGGFI